MFKSLKQLPLVTKIIFTISLILLFVWVIPLMVSYFKNVQVEEKSHATLQKNASKYGILDNSKKFNKESFTEEALKNVLNLSIEPIEDKSYLLKFEVDKEKIGNFTTFLETISFRYLVEITSPLTFKEADKFLEVTLTIKEL